CTLSPWQNSVGPLGSELDEDDRENTRQARCLPRWHVASEASLDALWADPITHTLARRPFLSHCLPDPQELYAQTCDPVVAVEAICLWSLAATCSRRAGESWAVFPR